MNKSHLIYAVLFVLGMATVIAYQSIPIHQNELAEVKSPRQDIKVAISFGPEELSEFTLKYSDCIPISGLADYAKDAKIVDIVTSKDGSSFILVLDNGTILIVVHRDDGMMVGKYFYLNNLPQD